MSIQPRAAARARVTLLAGVLLFAAFMPIAPARAAAALTIERLTWNVIGLDSNDVTSGPDTYPVGVRVCNTGDEAATNVAATFLWDSANPLINLDGPSTLTRPSLAAGACRDLYFWVTIARDDAAYDTARSYHVEVSADGVATATTPVPRELFVEHLVSQNRNNTAAVTGPELLAVGDIATYVADASTSTAYGQMENYLTFPSSMFRVISVVQTYSQPAGASNDTVYADACGWDPVPTSPDYNSCVGPENYTGGAVGGDIQTVYTVQAIAPGTAELHSMIYDQSGSSFHYNQTDFDVVQLVVTVVAPVDLALAKTVSDSAPAVGDDITYTLTVTNESAVDATGVEVTDQLPAGLTFVSAAPSQGSYDEATGIWTVGGVAGNESAVLDIVARVDQAGATDNTAEITDVVEPDGDSTPDNGDPTEDDQATVTVTPRPSADLSLTKDVDDASPAVGDDVVFTLALTNDGPADATGVEVTDVLPAGLDFVSATASQGTYTAATGVWNVGAIASLTTETLEVTATVTAAGALENTAEVTASDQPDPDSTPDNDDSAEDDQDTVTIGGPAPQEIDLALAKTVDAAAVEPGDDVTFTITLTNEGAVDATGVEVTERLPAGLTFVSADPSRGTYDDASGVWDVGPLAAGEEVTLDLVVTVVGGGARTNVAEVTDADQPDLDSTPDNDDSSEDDHATSTVGGRPADLSVTKTAAPPTAMVGDEVTFTITVSNDGPGRARDVEVTDALPDGFGLVTATASQGTYGTVPSVWAVGDVGAGASATLVMVATAEAAGTHANSAEVTNSGTADPDSIPDNGDPAEDDQDTVEVDVDDPNDPAADLSLTKTMAPSSPSVGQPITFTLTLRNDGPADATGVAVTDELADGLTLGTATATVGTYDSATGVWTVGALAAGAEAVLELVVTSAGRGAVANTAEVTAGDQPDPDSEPDNGDPAEDDQATVEGEVTTEALVIEKSVMPTGAVTRGTQLTYTVIVRNDGDAVVRAIALADELPAGLTYVSGSTTIDGVAVADGEIEIDALRPGDDVTVVFAATIDGTVADGTALTNVAEATPEGGAPVRSPAVTVMVVPPANVIATKSVTPTVAAAGQVVTWTISVTNRGGVASEAVLVRDEAPAGTTYVPGSTRLDGAPVADAAGASPLIAGIALGSLAPSQTRAVAFDTTVTAAGDSDIANVAQLAVGPTGDVVDVPSNQTVLDVTLSPPGALPTTGLTVSGQSTMRLAVTLLLGGWMLLVLAGPRRRAAAR